MSSKRNLLILALILPFMAVMAQVSFFSDTDLIWREGNPNSYGLAFRTGIHARIDAESYVEAHNYLDWWDFRKEKQRNKFYNRFRIGYACGPAELIEAMMTHPILINRPIVVTPLGTRLCRPGDSVAALLPA